MFNRAATTFRIASAEAALAAVVVASGALWLAPSNAVDPAKQVVAEALLPAQRAVVNGRSYVVDRWLARDESARRRLDAAHREIEMLRGQIDRLKAAGAEESAASPKLLDAEWTVARVLGRQARDYLVSRKMLDAGREQGVADGALAFSAEAMAIDLGADAGLRFGQLVVADDQRSFPAGPTLIGRVEQVSRHCSLLCRTQDDGFRLLVRTARRIEGRLQFGASGLLVGTGEPFCRLRYIPIDEPIAAGDEVFTLEGQGALDQPAYCGRVERIERLPSSGHWDVWVRPPSLATPVDRVAVLRFDLNEQRVASKTSDASGTTAKGAIE